MASIVPKGGFECELRIRRIRPPALLRQEQEGVTYLSASDYELAYETTLEFHDASRLSIRATLLGEENRQVVIRDAGGLPASLRGWVRGSVLVFDESDALIFRGTYFDVDLVITLDGDEALTTGPLRLEHWESAFGEGRYLGHAFSMRAAMTREAGALVGSAKGTIA